MSTRSPLRVLVKEFLDYMEANRSAKYTKLVRQFTEKWLTFFGAETLTTAITPRMIQRYAIARKKDKCKIKGTPVANATVNRDLAALKHMLHKAEIWGYVEISPGRRVEKLRDDGSVRTDYYTEEQLKLLVSTAVADARRASAEFQRLAGVHRARCQYRSSLQGNALPGVLGHRLERRRAARSQQKAGGLPAEGPQGTADSAQCAGDVCAANRCFRRSMPTSEYVFHQADGSPWKSILESFRSLLKRCGLKRSGVHVLRHTFGAQLAQKGVDMAVIRDLLGHHSVTLTEKYYAHLAPSSLSFGRAASAIKIGKFITQNVTQNGFCTIFGHQKR